MSKSPFFSIIVPIYNVEKYLEQCLDSICNQSFEDFELLLIDDGSPDKSPEICDKYALKDSRVRVFHKENQGLVEARKTGVCYAKGEYTIFVDSDDWIEKSMLENCYSFMKDELSEMAVLGFYYNYPEKEVRYKNNIASGFYEGDSFKTEILKKMLYTGEYYIFGVVPSVWSKIFKTEIIKKIIAEVDGKLTMGEDVALTYLYLANVKNVLVIDEAYYHYRYVENSMSRSSGEDYFKKIDILFEWLSTRQVVFGEQQLKMYQVMMFCLGMDRMFISEVKLNTAIKKIRIMYQMEKYQKIFNDVDIVNIQGNDKELVWALKYGRYYRVYVKYILKRLKRKIRALYKG